MLFSPVYSKHEDGSFIDSDSSMLNVAVSRAKDSFLVFGDMDLFELQPGSSPRGLLATYLFASASNALQFEFLERQDLSTTKTQVSALHGVEQHDAFLNQTFNAIRQSITIVSPWLTWQKLEQTGFLVSMAQARARVLISPWSRTKVLIRNMPIMKSAKRSSSALMMLSKS